MKGDDRPVRASDDLQDAAAEKQGMRRERERAAFLNGAEEDSQRRLGRGLTTEELARILDWYPAED